MPDPLQKLPLELWNWCIQLAIDGQRAGPLEFIMVSRRWERTLLELPVLWTQIYLHNGEDEMALVFTFLHLSKRSPLHVEILTGLPTMSSLELIAEHSARIGTISIRPEISNTMAVLCTEQWQRAASITMANLWEGLLPQDIKHTSCYGNAFRDNNQWSYSVILMHFTMEIGADKRNRIIRAESPDMRMLYRLWEEHIASAICDSINQDSDARTASIHAISELASCVRLHDAIRIAIPSFVKLLADDDWAIRSATLRVLHELADDANFRGEIGRTIPSLIMLLGDFNDIVRSAAVSTVVGLAGHAEIREAIMANIGSFIKPLEDQYPYARLATIKTINKLAKHVELWSEIRTIIPSLVGLIEDEYSYVRSATFRMVDKFTEHVDLWREIGIVLSFVKLLKKGNFDSRSNALSLLIKLANHGRFVAHDHPEIRKYAEMVDDKPHFHELILYILDSDWYKVRGPEQLPEGELGKAFLKRTNTSSASSPFGAFFSPKRPYLCWLCPGAHQPNRTLERALGHARFHFNFKPVQMDQKFYLNLNKRNDQVRRAINSRKRCDICDVDILIQNYSRHLKGQAHQKASAANSTQ